ncbi:MAG TPA: XRE family transcriptional regulator [Lachnoclostridium phytofermentans]|uniref:XRE family transcriptional regulator n=1 Tax=Lachnoclostridium phytofermentans TaxID=66219 RepID=A0A3D2X943_9FIRM|nr:helix-turn-helix transcriptional regulator [Lachnoclostridium sp.]HCL03631.1 XRE family transcriptional regulator [Lachnoclostridium phytofermentans]
MEIFEIIKKLCTEENIKISALERDLGFSRGAIYKMADSDPSADKIRKLADYFNVSADYLLGRTNDKNWINCNNISDMTYDIFVKFYEANKNSLTPNEKLSLVQMISSDSNK